MTGKRLRIYFDGSCPLCRQEIAHYRRADAAGRLDFVDVSKPDADPGPGLDRKQAMAWFHVREPGGALRSGADAFVAVWERLPRWRRAARLARVPGVLAGIEGLYRLTRPIRPHIARFMIRSRRAGPDFAAARQYMVDTHLARCGITDMRVLKAMNEVPREVFVAPDLADEAYADGPLPIAFGQMISQPYMVAMMLEAAEIGPRDRVLDIGTGSGYAAALLSRLAGDVYTIERDATLFATARDRLQGYDVHARLSDGAEGWPAHAPFDVIVAAAAAQTVPAALKDQLADGGRLLAPVGDRLGQRLVKLTRRSRDDYRAEDLGPVMFVPLTPGVRNGSEGS